MPHNSNSPLKQQFLQTMRQVASTVSVVTTDGEDGMHGATVSAFNSLSIEPSSILICIHNASKISEAIQTNKQFRVNLLNEKQQHISSRFAGVDDATLKNRFTDIAISKPDNFISPHIDDTISIVCELNKMIPYDTHNIFIGLVLNCVQPTPISPLIYLNGQYQRVELLTNSKD